MLVIRKVAKITEDTVKAAEKVGAKSPVKEVVKEEKHKELPPDEYKTEVTKTIPLSDANTLYLQVKRSGEFGLPVVDLRIFTQTKNYIGFTKKGFVIPVNLFANFITTCWDVNDEIESRGLISEYDEDEDSEDESEDK